MVVTGAVVDVADTGAVVGATLGAAAGLLGATPVLTAAGVVSPGPLTTRVTAAEVSIAASTPSLPIATLTGRVRLEESVDHHDGALSVPHHASPAPVRTTPASAAHPCTDVTGTGQG